MATYDANNAECLVYTFKDGLLSKVAHDLKIQAANFSIEVDVARKAIKATVDASSLKVACSMKNGEEKHDVLRDKDKNEIQGNIVKDVLHAEKHPQITFTSTEVNTTGDGYDIAGTLSLHGTEKPVHGTATKVGDKLSLEFTIHQPDFGIKPFSAMLGALKVKPDVKLKIVVPA